MMEMNSRGLRFLARMGSRGAFGQGILDLADEGVDFFAASADLGRASGFDRFLAKYPERYVNVGIAEQSLVGTAAGLSAMGVPVFATTYAPFASLRCADQLKNYLGYMGYNIKMIGLDSGMIQCHFGASHFGMEDIAVLRTIPNVKIISPSDGREIYAAVEAIAKIDSPVYLRLTGGQVLPIIHKDENYSFEIGKAISLQEGFDVAFVATGTMVANALEAAKKLEQEQDLSVTVIDMHTIKPLDTACLEALCHHRLVITVEEHSIMGGLGSAVAEYFGEKKEHPPVLRLGIHDFYPHPGSYEYLLQTCGLDAKGIFAAVLNFMEKNSI